ncbi:DJ-1/PfpI family protein [Paenibacillus sp. SC116]|uniref:DJ-1/PfpI family protein n=1 Tax=Paenibacillus sp. SC116 TaxID=2968986 RepID=UPI00215AA5F4|nr:DJ-1/PfpI family protein [Paenibacillus sp. SC116]MCR8842586.1 DJ-1/PfpI family protein [Paenibacillus sp. SC116]
MTKQDISKTLREGLTAKTERVGTAAMLLYPGMTALDLVGPQYVFAALMQSVHLVAKSNEPVLSDTGLAIVPTITFEDCPEKVTILFVPGGSEGTLTAMEDEATLSFVKSRGGQADYVTSVCTGSLILAAAGLLEDYKATSHWATKHLLEEAGVEPVEGRVVFDRNRVTGGGVTAGIDFGLALAGRIRGDEYAKLIQLIAEYSPEPPYRAGTPCEAGEAATKHVTEMFVPFVTKARELLQRAND